MSSAPAALALDAPPEPVVTGADRRRVWLLLAGSVLGLALFVAIYVLFVRTHWGQEWDDKAFGGPELSTDRLRWGSGHLLYRIRAPSLLLLSLLLTAVALWRGRPRVAFAVGVLVFGSVALAEVLKWVLPRPDLTGSVDNSLPSGHTAIAVALGMALVLVTVQSRRPLAAAAGVLYGSVMGIGIYAAAWHRPSDVLAAIALVFAVACAVAAVMILWRGGVGVPERQGPLSAWTRIGFAAGVAVFAVLALIWAIAGEHPGVSPAELGAEFIATSVLIGGLCLAAFLAFLALLRGVTVDASDRERARRQPAV